MIALASIIRAIEKESTYWRKRDQTEFIKGIIKGLSIAIELIKKLPNYKVRPLYKQ